MKPAAWCDWFLVRLEAAIAREAPPGIGGYAPAWERVEAPSAALLGELARVEAGTGSREEATRLGQAVLAAWRATAPVGRLAP